MYTDMHKVRHILLNLLSYRVRMTAQGIIVFKATRTQEKDIDWVTFQIRDTGIGLSQEEIGKIFLPFIFSINPYERMELGLMIARPFSEMIGGNMTIESELGQGTMFTVRLPANV